MQQTNKDTVKLRNAPMYELKTIFTVFLGECYNFRGTAFLHAPLNFNHWIYQNFRLGIVAKLYTQYWMFQNVIHKKYRQGSAVL